MQPRCEVPGRMRGQPWEEMLALQPFSADAPDSATDLAAAFGIADAWIVAPMGDAIGSGVAETHAVKGIRAPVIVRRDRLRVPVGGGDRRVHSDHAALLKRLMFSA